MTVAILALLGLALLDAMNPFSIAVMAFLLATDRPAERGWAFALGTFAVYLIFGVALLEGWTALLRNLLPLLPAWLPGAAELLGGLACLSAAAWMWRKGGGGTGALPQASSLSIGATLAFAVGSTLSDLPTAVPYFAAATQIPLLADGRPGEYTWLLAYNLIYVAPLLVMLGARLALGSRAEGVMSAVRRAVDWVFNHLLPPLLLILGAALMVWDPLESTCRHASLSIL